MCAKIVSWVAMALAVVLAVLAVALPAESIHLVILISRFFEVMLPILAVGALFKYLCK